MIGPRDPHKAQIYKPIYQNDPLDKRIPMRYISGGLRELLEKKVLLGESSMGCGPGYCGEG